MDQIKLAVATDSGNKQLSKEYVATIEMLMKDGVGVGILVGGKPPEHDITKKYHGVSFNVLMQQLDAAVD